MSTSVPDFTPKSSYIYEESPGLTRESYFSELPTSQKEERFTRETLLEYSALYHEIDFLVTYLREGTRVVVNSSRNAHYPVLMKLFPKLHLDLWTHAPVDNEDPAYEVFGQVLTEKNCNRYRGVADVLYISYLAEDETELVRVLKPRAALLILPQLDQNYTYFRGYMLAPYLISEAWDNAYCFLQVERREDGAYEQCSYDVESIKSKLSYRDLAVKKEILFYNNLDRSIVVFGDTNCTLEVCRILWLFWRYAQFFNIDVAMAASVETTKIIIKFIESNLPGFTLFEYAKGAQRMSTTTLESSVRIPMNIRQIQSLLLDEEELLDL